jgi:hypothetical protein
MAMNGKTGVTVLRLTLGIVILVEAILFVLPGAAHVGNVVIYAAAAFAIAVGKS